jgi:hypothetical protein
MVQSNSDNRAYALTAGHCVSLVGTRSTVWRTKMPSTGNIHNIGPAHNHVNNGDRDGAILRIDNPSGWAPSYRQLVRSSGGGWPTTYNEMYPILHVGTVAMIPGGYLCKTGAATHTTCGRFISSGFDLSPGPNDVALVNMRGCGGDSGAGVFVGNRAYGIVVQRANAYTGPIVDFGIGPSGGTNCGNSVYYQGLAGPAGLLDRFNVRLYGTSP